MRYLGLDVGTKTIGVAISDKTNIIASPMKTIRFNELNEVVIDEIIEIINNNEITDIAIGLPKNMDNSLGFASKRSWNFKILLEQKTKANIEFIDERLTTVEAENILINNNYRREKRKKIIDSVAAVIILENYLKMKGNK